MGVDVPDKSIFHIIINWLHSHIHLFECIRLVGLDVTDDQLIFYIQLYECICHVEVDIPV